jgi:predicted dithiol-disulfide oxidoreductase (DUF899 family)
VTAAHDVVPHDAWIEARTALLAREKEFTRLRDELSQARRDLPWEPVEKDYVFDAPDGPRSLADLFAGRSQLIVYHFMWPPDWDAGCLHCSFWGRQLRPDHRPPEPPRRDHGGRLAGNAGPDRRLPRADGLEL